MKRFLIVGIAVVIIAGIAVTMALINNTALADNTQDQAKQANVLATEAEDVQTAVTQDPVTDPAGPNFVDEDGDGLCDVCGQVPGTGTGSQNGHGATGSNFVDLDGDGLCDDCTPLAPADGTGNQYGRPGGQGGQGQRGGGRRNN